MDYTHQTLFMIRPLKASQKTVDAVSEQLGRSPRVVFCPLIKIKNYDCPLPENMPQPFVFTSSNAVDVVQSLTKQRGATICVGEKVAHTASKAGFDVIGTFNTAKKMIANGFSLEFTYFQGKQTSVDLAPYGAISHVLYEQTPVALDHGVLAEMKLGGLIPVYSENAAVLLMNELNGQKIRAVAICISENVAKRLDSSMFGRILIADDPTSAAMVNCIVKEI